MINLLPPDVQRTNRREYWIRIGSVWGLLVSGVFIVTILLLTPSYVLLTSSHRAVDLELRDTSAQGEEFTQAEAEIVEANTITRQLKQRGAPVAISEILATIDRNTGRDIVLRTYTLTREEKTIKTIQVQGTARSRTSLATFKADLEREALFENAAIPISDLARDEDLPFVLTVTIASIRK